ncbi:hypothetical protein G1H11_08600 [Phytoactinopolyspora alkaliphila]|uniref:Uncharacterized protein n=1 Tax=Phytoactinopolyspora alkaliphila TaxID=1783498 RepID=A0A6N9YK76_9ACTN|nr:hypothetical protein [Phytoactinopolyspora alkaliphila]NED95374.1 hypothetical protein [Phytoactinopolyspora alkaliphila]
MTTLSSARRAAIVLTAGAMAVTGLTAATAAADQTPAQLPAVAQFDPHSVRLTDFTGPEQTIAPYLALVAHVANGVVDDDPELYGFIDCACWRVGVDAPTNARVQENALTMAYFYSMDRPWNPYYGDDALRLRLEAALTYWMSLQSPEGAFPELPHDTRSRPGTAFSLDFLGRTLLDVLDQGPGIDPDVRADVEQSIRRAAEWFLTDETQVWSEYGEIFSNQVAAGLTAISGLIHRLDDPELTALFRTRVDYLAERMQSPAGHYYEEAVGHRYSVQVMSKDLGHWADPETQPVIDVMQERYLDWLQYQALPEPDGSGFFINTALDARHSRWNYEEVMAIGAGHSWSARLAAARAFGDSAENVAQARDQWRAGGWATSVAPVVEQRRTRVDPVLIRDVFADEHYPTAAEKAAATAALRPMSEDGFTHHATSGKVDLTFLHAQRGGLLVGMAWGPQPNFPPGRPSQRTDWDYPRHGRQYLWHQDTGMVIQSHNAVRAGGPSVTGIDDELVWSTIVPGSGLVDAYLDHDVSFSQDGDHVAAPEDTATGSVSATSRRHDGGEGPVVTTTVDDDGLTVAVRSAGRFIERLPLALRHGDTMAWLDEDGVPQVTTTTADEATGLLIGRGAQAIEVRWDRPRQATVRPTSVVFPQTPALGTDPDVVGTLHLLDITGVDELTYRVGVVDDACLNSDLSPTVVIGGIDSKVENRDRGDGCTVLDLIAAGDPWPGHGTFVRHVDAVTRELRSADVLSAREAAAVRAAAAASAIGDDRAAIQLDATEVLAGSVVTGTVSGDGIDWARIAGPCVDGGQVEVPGAGSIELLVAETTLVGPCELSLTTRFTDGGSELDEATVDIVPDAEGVVFRDSFSGDAAGAWQVFDGNWSIDTGAYVQTDASLTGKRTGVRDLGFTDGFIEFDVEIVDAAGDPTNWAGVQLRTTRFGDNFTDSGYMVFMRQTGEVFVYKAGAGTIARGDVPASVPSRIRVEAQGPELTILADGEHVVTATDDEFTSGSVHLVTGRTHSRFDNVVVGQK